MAEINQELSTGINTSTTTLPKETIFINPQPMTNNTRNFRISDQAKDSNRILNQNKIDYILANIQGIITNRNNKVQFLRDVTRTKNDSQIIALTETWAKGHFDAEFQKHFVNYNIMRADRRVTNVHDKDQLQSRGGVMMLTTPDITITPILEFTNGNCEVAIANLPTVNTTIILMYRPSGKGFSFSKYSEAISKINDFLTENAAELKDRNVTLLGDFNFPPPIVQWKRSALGVIADFAEGDSIQKSAFEMLLSMTEDHQLDQIVTLPTRGKNTIDLIFTNRPTMFEEQSIRNLHPLSDHNMVKFQLINPTCIHPQETQHTKLPQPEIASYNFSKADHQKMKEQLNSTNWDEITTVTNTKPIQTLANSFITGLIGVAKAAKIPLYSHTKQKENQNTAQYLSQVNDLHRKLAHPHCTITDKEYITKKIAEVNAKIQEAHEKEIKRKEGKAVQKIKANPKAFFKYANQSKKTKTTIGPLKYGDFYYNGSQKMAQILSDQYRSVFVDPKENYDQLTYTRRQLTPLADVVMTKEMFVEAMKNIDPTSAPGPDGVSAYVYHHFAEELAQPVMNIWQQSLALGLMPEGTILAIITPIFKSIDKSVPANYRPVALTNHLTKIFERVLKKIIVKHMEDKDLMNRTQHGFRKHHSTVTQILTYYDSILTMLEAGHAVDSVYLDFSKAFDKVDHQILLKKVESLGITGNILAWIKMFLVNRQQQVRVEDSLSAKEWVKSGVPQGSVLGPLLFLIMMIDINNDIKNSWLGSYADDTRLWKCIHAQQDQQILQEDLNTLYVWAEQNNMLYNDNKFELITFGTNNSRIYTSPNGLPITRKESIKDLGVYVSSDGNFDTHITNAVKATQQVSAWILRTFRTRNKEVMKTLLKSLIIPKIEYASVVWSPITQKNINLVENIQRRFTSRISEYQTQYNRINMPICTTDYWDRLKDLRIYSLERRRERFLILYLYRFILGLIDIPCFEVYQERGITIKSKYNNKAPESIKKLRRSSFFYRGPQLYNILPEKLRILEEIVTPTKGHVESYKKRLDDFLKGIPDQPTIPGLQRVAETNSLIHQIPLMAIQRR